METVKALAEKILSIPPKQQTLLVAIDGRGGSGKRTLAEQLKSYLPNSCIVHLDDFNSLELNQADRPRLLAQVISPLKKDMPARYQRLDWVSNQLAEWHEIPLGGIVIVEGVSTL